MPAAHATTEFFLVAMAIIFAMPYLIWRGLRTDYYAPLVVVQIIAGVLLGPGILGKAFPDYYGSVFSAPVVAALNGIAWWAVMLFVFIAGIELDLRQAWARRFESGVTAALALGVPLLFGCLAAAALVARPGWLGGEARDWQFVTGVGMACAVTALPVLIVLMEQLEILRQPLGQRMLRYASLDDVAIWSVLAVILLDWSRLGRQAGFLAAFAVAAWLFRKLMRALAEADRWYVALIWLSIASWGAHWSGLHFMVGAFLAGVVIDADWFRREDLDRFRRFVVFAFMPIYFLSTGLRTNWGVGGAAIALVAVALLLAAVAGKLIGAQLAGRILGWQEGEGSVVGWLLQTKGLITLVFISVLLDKALISQATFTALLLMSVASTMLTVPMVTPRLRRRPQLVGRAF
jgi:Kef-type K+ transport system membrane component KefB